MRLVAAFLQALACAGILLVGSFSPTMAGDPTYLFSSDDPEMNDAIKGARATLDDFLNLIQTGGFGGSDPSVKVAVPYGADNREHIWMGDFQMAADGSFEATVANAPVNISGMNLGDRYAFNRDQISDWMYFDNNKIHGAYTLRAMLPRMSAEQAAGFREALAPLPQ